ncbi:MAG TPA: phosphoribosyltransferase family protein, partial [Candidatus Paceibacterota bacterium]
AIIRDSHFVYTKGELGPDRDHGPDYINKDAITVHPLLVVGVANELVDFVLHAKIQTIASPAVAGAIIGSVTANWLGVEMGKEGEVKFVYLDKEGDGLALKRGFPEFVRGQRVCVVEDVLNSGGTARQTVDVVRQHGGQVVAVVAIANHGGVTAESLGVGRLHSLIDVPMPKYPSNDCPLCKAGVPVRVDLGHGHEFLRSLPSGERRRLAPPGYTC